VIVSRITLPSSTSETIQILHQKAVQILFRFKFLSTQSVEFGSVAGVTECHADDGGRIADRYPVERLKITFAND